MKITTSYKVLSVLLLGIISCGREHPHLQMQKDPSNKNPYTHDVYKSDKVEEGIDIQKRNALVEKYDLMNFPKSDERVFMNVQEFFDGNNDPGSLAPNLSYKPAMKVYYTIFDQISKQTNVTAVLVEINEVMIYEGNKLDDSEWFFADNIYIIGNITVEEVREKTKNLYPDEVGYENDNYVQNLDPEYRDKKIISVWWD